MNILAKLLLTTGEVARKQFEEKVLEFERRAGDVDLKDPPPPKKFIKSSNVDKIH